MSRITIYDVLERGVYRPHYIPRGKSKSDGTPIGPNDRGFIPAHYNFLTTAGVSVRVLEQNSRLKFLQLQNMSLVNDIIYAFGKAASLQDGITLTPGQVEIFDVSVPIEFMEVFCIASNQRLHIVTGI